MNLKQLFRSEDTVAFQVRLPSRRAACRPAVEGLTFRRAASSVHACLLSFGGSLCAKHSDEWELLFCSRRRSWRRSQQSSRPLSSL